MYTAHTAAPAPVVKMGADVDIDGRTQERGWRVSIVRQQVSLLVVLSIDVGSSNSRLPSCLTPTSAAHNQSRALHTQRFALFQQTHISFLSKRPATGLQAAIKCNHTNSGRRT